MPNVARYSEKDCNFFLAPVLLIFWPPFAPYALSTSLSYPQLESKLFIPSSLFLSSLGALDFREGFGRCSSARPDLLVLNLRFLQPQIGSNTLDGLVSSCPSLVRGNLHFTILSTIMLIWSAPLIYKLLNTYWVDICLIEHMELRLKL